MGETIEFDIPDPKNPKVRHFFRFVNALPLNESNQDILVNTLEYWELREGACKYFCWVTDLTITTGNAYQIMRGGRARWKVENETFNTLKNQGYHIEHNYGLGKKNLSMVFVTLMMLAFLVDQILQMSPSSLSAPPWKKQAQRKICGKRLGLHSTSSTGISGLASKISRNASENRTLEYSSV